MGVIHICNNHKMVCWWAIRLNKDKVERGVECEPPSTPPLVEPRYKKVQLFGTTKKPWGGGEGPKLPSTVKTQNRMDQKNI